MFIRKKKHCIDQHMEIAWKRKIYWPFLLNKMPKFVTWYHQTVSIRQTQRNYLSTYAESPLARKSILRLLRNVHRHRAVENWQASRVHGASSNQEKIVANYFVQSPSRSLGTTEENLTIPWSSVYNILRNRCHMFPHKLDVVQQLEERCFPNIKEDASFLNFVIFSKKCFFASTEKSTTTKRRIWGTENPPGRRQTTRDSGKVPVRARCMWIKYLVRTTSTVP